DLQLRDHRLPGGEDGQNRAPLDERVVQEDDQLSRDRPALVCGREGQEDLRLAEGHRRDCEGEHENERDDEHRDDDLQPLAQFLEVFEERHPAPFGLILLSPWSVHTPSSRKAAVALWTFPNYQKEYRSSVSGSAVLL